MKLESILKEYVEIPEEINLEIEESIDLEPRKAVKFAQMLGYHLSYLFNGINIGHDDETSDIWLKENLNKIVKKLERSNKKIPFPLHAFISIEASDYISSEDRGGAPGSDFWVSNIDPDDIEIKVYTDLDQDDVKMVSGPAKNIILNFIDIDELATEKLNMMV